MAQAGICSRRQAEEKILQGLVSVNGQIVNTLGTQVDETKDEVRYNGRLIAAEKKRYFLFYKPTGVLSSVSDSFGRPTVTDWFTQFDERLYPVGRLDANTSGLLLMSNDGDFVNQMIHPRYKIEKTYEALVRGRANEETVRQLRGGILIDGEKMKADEVRLIRHLQEETVLDITIHQGKKRQVRLMCAAVGHPVVALVRTKFAFLTLENLKPGEFRPLTPQEVETLRRWAQQAEIPDKSNRKRMENPSKQSFNPGKK